MTITIHARGIRTEAGDYRIQASEFSGRSRNFMREHLYPVLTALLNQRHRDLGELLEPAIDIPRGATFDCTLTPISKTFLRDLEKFGIGAGPLPELSLGVNFAQEGGSMRMNRPIRYQVESREPEYDLAVSGYVDAYSPAEAFETWEAKVAELYPAQSLGTLVTSVAPVGLAETLRAAAYREYEGFTTQGTFEAFHYIMDYLKDRDNVVANIQAIDHESMYSAKGIVYSIMERLGLPHGSLSTPVNHTELAHSLWAWAHDKPCDYEWPHEAGTVHHIKGSLRMLPEIGAVLDSLSFDDALMKKGRILPSKANQRKLAEFIEEDLRVITGNDHSHTGRTAEAARWVTENGRLMSAKFANGKKSLLPAPQRWGRYQLQLREFGQLAEWQRDINAAKQPYEARLRADTLLARSNRLTTSLERPSPLVTHTL